MKIRSALVLITLFVISVIVSSQSEGQVYCGRRLAAALNIFCNSNLIKRSRSKDMPTQDIDLGWPWIEMHRAYSMGRSKRQVVAECCEKPCTKEELLTYCSD
ncbi:unnamed protein product [Euphydryas editha]|uniref:Insulin-like domain-containing protein n=1 Tax=Euphydryas editha TaxID=104508 RepID=A0AAU9UC30_EUPED|nr:unnamed protein product [Euphydryas editha]